MTVGRGDMQLPAMIMRRWQRIKLMLTSIYVGAIFIGSAVFYR